MYGGEGKNVAKKRSKGDGRGRQGSGGGKLVLQGGGGKGKLDRLQEGELSAGKKSYWNQNQISLPWEIEGRRE